MKNGIIDESELDYILDVFDAERVVFGHTQVDEVTRLYGDKLIAIDVKLKSNSGEAIVFSNSEVNVVRFNETDELK